MQIYALPSSCYRPAVLDNPLVTGAGAGAWQLATSDYWGVPLSHAGSHKSWRPVTSLSFRLNMLAAGPRPDTFHTANLLLHGAVTAAFLLLVSRLAPQLVAECPRHALLCLDYPGHGRSSHLPPGQVSAATS